MNISTASTLQLLVRREFWEHRAFLFAPAIVAAIMVLVAIFAPNELHVVGEPDAKWLEHRNLIVAGALSSIAVPFAIVMGIVTVFYLLDSLYADRKDRSVLFWKSLPLSDSATVFSKLLTAALIVPLLTLAAIFVTNLLVAFILSLRLSGLEQLQIWSTVWQPGIWLRIHGLMLYALVISMLWYLPVYAWFLLASAWARRAVILWAALPPIFVIILEHFMFDTSHFAELLANRVVGWTQFGYNSSSIEIDGERISWPQQVGDFVDLSAFLTSPGLWGGLIVAGVFLWAAILLRRRQGAN